MFLERFFKGSRLFPAPVNLRILVLSGGILEQFLWLSGLLFDDIWFATQLLDQFCVCLVCQVAVKFFLCQIGLASCCSVCFMLVWLPSYCLVSFMSVMLPSGFFMSVSFGLVQSLWVWRVKGSGNLRVWFDFICQCAVRFAKCQFSLSMCSQVC